MPVTMPRTFTVVPLQAALAPSFWMLVIVVMPVSAGGHGCGRSAHDRAAVLRCPRLRAAEVDLVVVGVLRAAALRMKRRRRSPAGTQPRALAVGARARSVWPTASIDHVRGVAQLDAARVRDARHVDACRACARERAGGELTNRNDLPAGATCRRARSPARSRVPALLVPHDLPAADVVCARSRRCGSGSSRRCRRRVRGRRPARGRSWSPRARRAPRWRRWPADGGRDRDKTRFHDFGVLSARDPTRRPQTYRGPGRTGDTSVTDAARLPRAVLACPLADLIAGLDPHPSVARVQPCVPSRSVRSTVGTAASSASSVDRRRVAVGVLLADLDRGDPRSQASSSAGRPGSALPWWATLRTSTGSSGERRGDAALGVGGQQHRERAGLQPRHHRVVVRVAARPPAGGAAAATGPRTAARRARAPPPRRAWTRVPARRAGVARASRQPAGAAVDHEPRRVRARSPAAPRPRGRPRRGSGSARRAGRSRPRSSRSGSGRPHAGVDEHRRRAALHQRRVALAHVEERHDDLAGARASARRPATTPRHRARPRRPPGRGAAATTAAGRARPRDAQRRSASRERHAPSSAAHAATITTGSACHLDGRERRRDGVVRDPAGRRRAAAPPGP